MQIVLPSDLEQFVKQQVDLGHYADANELIGEALRLLQGRRGLMRELEEKIDRGLADVAAGRVYTPDEALDYLDRRSAERAAALK